MEFITYEQDGFVGVITINRPKALNALNSQVLDELNATLDAVNLDETRALVLTGAGAVSYTHLDVYKRQSNMRSVRRMSQGTFLII